MAGFNVVVIKGNLVASGELKRWTDGSPYCNFTIANNESYKDQNGEWQSIPSYFDCVIRGSYAESMSPYLTKGRGVEIVGRLKQNRWETDGQKHSKVVIKVQSLNLAPIHNSDNSQQNYSNPASQQNYQNKKPQTEFNANINEQEYIPFDESGFSEDIPF